MPRYFFPFFDGHSVMDDTEGTELPNLSAAQYEAAKDVEHLRQSKICGRRNWAGWVLRVLDESGCILFELPFVGRKGRDGKSVRPRQDASP